MEKTSGKEGLKGSRFCVPAGGKKLLGAGDLRLEVRIGRGEESGFGEKTYSWDH